MNKPLALILAAAVTGCTAVNLPRDPGYVVDRSVYPDNAVYLSEGRIGENAPRPRDDSWGALKRWAHDTKDPAAPWAGVRQWIREQETR